MTRPPAQKYANRVKESRKDAQLAHALENTQARIDHRKLPPYERRLVTELGQNWGLSVWKGAHLRPPIAGPLSAA